jgi:DNA gyrase subunit A
MARRSGPGTIDLSAFDKPGKNVYNTTVEVETQKSFLEYAYSVVHSRALPDARDGLKPVHRRILFAMDEMGLRPDRGYVKSGRVVGDVMGKFHPHGDLAIYEALVRMAQPWSLNTCLVDGHGNFGSPDDGPAASRYTEAKLDKTAMLLTGELGEDTVDFKLNYSGDAKEPVVLPAAFPNLLVNGTAGIAVGMATNMIPHNLGEVVNAARWLLTHPNASLDKLMEFVPGPDLPTGGLLLGMDKVREAYETGRGVVRMRAKASIGPLPGSRGRQAITVTELPYQVGPEKVIEKIKAEVAKKTLQGIADVKDLTDMNSDGTNLVIECKVGVNPQALLADLYRLTPLESSFGINNLALVDGQPRTLGLKDLLQVFLDHRVEVVTRRSMFRRTKREERLHLVDGLVTALLNIDKVIKVIRAAANSAAAKTDLIKAFRLSDIQAQYILDTPLRRLTKYDRLELDAEAEKLRAEIAELTAILDDEGALKKVIAAELAQVAKDHAAPRRTVLMDGDLAVILEESKPAGPLEITDDPCQVILSATGLLARTAADTEDAAQVRRRNGRVKHDAILAVVNSTTRGQVLLVTNKGRAFKTDVLPIPALPQQAGTTSLRTGVPAKDLVPLTAGERVVTIAPLGSLDDAKKAGSPGLAVGTKGGIVKVVAPDWPVRSDEFEVISLKGGDEIVGARWLTSAKDTLVFVTTEASLLRFDAAKVRPQGLKGAGMAGINLPAGAFVLSFDVVPADAAKDAVVVTSTGGGTKVTPFTAYPAKGRATAGVRAQRFLKTESRLVFAWVGANPAAASSGGDPVDLPEIDPRRDGSGYPVMAPDLIGTLLERD